MGGEDDPGFGEGLPGRFPHFVEQRLRPVEGDELGGLAAHRREPADFPGNRGGVEDRQVGQNDQTVRVMGVQLHDPVVVDPIDLVAQIEVRDVPFAGLAEPDIAVDIAVVHMLQQQRRVGRRQRSLRQTGTGGAEDALKQFGIVLAVGGAAVTAPDDLALVGPILGAVDLDDLGGLILELGRHPLLPEVARDPSLVEMIVGRIVFVGHHDEVP